MEIGSHVCVTEESVQCGLGWDQRLIDNLLELGKIYTVTKIISFPYECRIQLEGISKEYTFNIKNFVDKTEREKKNDIA